MKWTVPSEPFNFSFLLFKIYAVPKSQILAWSSASSKIFYGFISLCTMFYVCTINNIIHMHIDVHKNIWMQIYIQFDCQSGKHLNIWMHVKISNCMSLSMSPGAVPHVHSSMSRGCHKQQAKKSVLLCVLYQMLLNQRKQIGLQHNSKNICIGELGSWPTDSESNSSRYNRCFSGFRKSTHGSWV